MRTHSGWTLPAVIVSSCLIAAVARSQTYEYRLLVDADNDASTGCSVPVHDAGGPATFQGVERAVAVSVDRTAAGGTVTGVTLLQCVAGVLMPGESISAGGWAVGRGTGTGGADVVEAAVPSLALGNGALVRVAFTASLESGGSDVMATATGAGADPPIFFQLSSLPAPVFSPVGIAACIAAFASLAWVALRRRTARRAFVVIAALAAAGAATVALALTIQLDGQTQDWQGAAPVATDPTGDSSLSDAAEDLVAGFLTTDGTTVYVRFDVLDVNVCSSKSDGSPVAGCCFSNTDCTPPQRCGSDAPNVCSFTLGWYNLQWPQVLDHTISVVNRTATVYGQIWIGGVTNQPGATPGLLAQAGYGPVGSNPAGNAAWTWVDAVFNVDSGVNDEFMASFLPETTGTFDYVYRFSGTGGLTWHYGNVGGPVPDGQVPPNPGKLTVSPSDDTTDPAAPTNLVVTGRSATKISLAWDPVVGDATLYGYEVLRGGAPGGPYAQIVRLTGTSYEDTAVIENAAYVYVVRAVDLSFNRSGNSNEASATATARTVTVTFNVTVPASTDGTGHSVFIAGALDRLKGGLPSWNPGGVELTRVDATHWTITLTGDELTALEYKYALGEWIHVEKDAACGEITNRLLTLFYGATGTMSVNDTVQNWRNVAPCGN